MEMSGQFHAPVSLSRGKESPVPIGLELGWVPEHIIKSLLLPGIEFQYSSP